VPVKAMEPVLRSRCAAPLTEGPMAALTALVQPTAHRRTCDDRPSSEVGIHA